MKTIHRTSDTQLIRSILEVENIYEKTAYDGSPKLKDFVPKGIWFVLKDGQDIAGAITLKQLNNVLWIPHIFIFEQHRGNDSHKWGTQVAEFMRKNCGTKKFMAMTPYKTAKRYAEKMGFKMIATLTNSIKKDGELLDQYILELE